MGCIILIFIWSPYYGNPIFYWIWIEYITFCRSLFMHLLIIMVWMFLFFYESVEKWIRYNHKYSSVLVKHGMNRIYEQNDLIHSWNHSKLNSWIEDNLYLWFSFWFSDDIWGFWACYSYFLWISHYKSLY